MISGSVSSVLELNPIVIFSYACKSDTLSKDVLLLRTLKIAASFAKLAISAPENPPVKEDNSS